MDIDFTVKVEEGKRIDELEREFDAFCDELEQEFDKFEQENKDLAETIRLEDREETTAEGHFDHIQETIDLEEPEEQPKEEEFKELKTSWGNPAYIRDIYQ
jgi:hypothetical protein